MDSFSHCIAAKVSAHSAGRNRQCGNHMLRRYRKVHLIDSHGIEITLLLSKSALLKIGEPYRFYFQKGARPAVGNDYLDAALSTNSFLGYEAISEPEEHPDPSSET